MEMLTQASAGFAKGLVDPASLKLEASSSRLNSIQFMRFLAAFLVLITHCGFYVHERLDGSFEYWRRGASGVVLFFVISGFVMIISSEKLAVSDDGWKIFSVRRLLRIVPIYWIATSVKVVATLFAAEQVLHTGFDVPLIIKSYLFLPSYNPIDGTIQPLLGVGWTLVFEMFFYLLFALALMLKVEPIKFVGVIILVISLISLFRSDLVEMERHSIVYFLLDSIMLNFVFGMVLGGLFRKKIILGVTASLASIGLGLLSIVFDVFGVLVPIPPILSIGLASFFVLWGSVSLEQRAGLTVPRPFVFLAPHPTRPICFILWLRRLCPWSSRRLELLHLT